VRAIGPRRLLAASLVLLAGFGVGLAQAQPLRVRLVSSKAAPPAKDEKL